MNARNGLGVYAIGGGKKMRWFSSVERYDMINNVWVEAPSLLDTRFSGVAAALDDGTIVAAGGGSKKTQLLSSCEVLQPGAAEWVWASNMSETRFASSMVASRGCVWALAGFDGKRYLNTCEFLIPASASGSPAAAAVQARRAHLHLRPSRQHGVRADAIIVAGGFDGTQPISKVECLDLRMLSSWTELPDMGSSRSYGASARLRGVVYTVGGMAATDRAACAPDQVLARAADVVGRCEDGCGGGGDHPAVQLWHGASEPASGGAARRPSSAAAGASELEGSHG